MKNIAHKLGLLISTLLLMVTGLAGVALADGGGEVEGEMQIVNGYQITLVWTNPVQLGENQFHLRVSDAQSQPVTHAEIAVSLVESETGQAEAEHSDAGPGAVETSHDTHNSSADSAAHSNMDMPGDPDAHGVADRLTLEPGVENGEYAGAVVIPQTGNWIIRAHLMIDDMPMEIDYPVTVAPTQNGLGILTSFIAVNVVIIGAAAVLRPRKPAKIQPA